MMLYLLLTEWLWTFTQTHSTTTNAITAQPTWNDNDQSRNWARQKKTEMKLSEKSLKACIETKRFPNSYDVFGALIVKKGTKKIQGTAFGSSWLEGGGGGNKKGNTRK